MANRLKFHPFGMCYEFAVFSRCMYIGTPLKFEVCEDFRCLKIDVVELVNACRTTLNRL